MPISEETYKRVALEADDEQWELVCGRLRQKPAMTIEHEDIDWRLNTLLVRQLDASRFLVSQTARLRHSGGSFYIPDLCVIPVELVRRIRRERPRELAVLDEPLPLVVEIWSPSTGGYDVETKLPDYRERGDLEIWLLHPYEQTLTAWQRRQDGTYIERTYTAEAVAEPHALPGVRIALAALFE